MIKVPNFISELQPYKPGNQFEKTDYSSPFSYLINLASNENPLGPSPRAVDAIQSCLNELALYPQTGSYELVNNLSKHYQIDKERIIATHGSESLITHIINAFSEQGEEILTAQVTFVGIFVSTNKLGRKIRTVPMNNHSIDLEAIFNAITNDTKIIYLANVNNPTGTMFTKSEFDIFINKVPQNILVILDEAYFHYSAVFDDYPNGLEYDFPNLILARTFSKSHGLAGLRVGYGIGPIEIIKTLYKVKLPFEPSLIAQKAATAAVDDDEFVNKTIKINSLALKMLTDKLDELGINYPDPKANFVFINFDTDADAAKFCSICLKNGVIVRQTTGFGMPTGVRISTGTLEETEYAAEVIEKAYKMTRI